MAAHPLDRTDGPLLVAVEDGVAVLTLHRPAKRNALDGELVGRLTEAVRALDDADDVAAIVLTGTDPAFCAGVDLAALAAGDTALVLPRGQRGPFPPRTTPLIGAVNGPAVTGGLELALACDWLVASERASFADTHARVGVMPGWGMSVLLPQAVGVRRAREMSLTGNYVDARTALVWGLVDRVVAHDQVVPTARRMAADVASNQPAAVRSLLALYDETAAGSLDEAWDAEGRRSREWARTQLDPARIDAVRGEVIARGRAQQR